MAEFPQCNCFKPGNEKGSALTYTIVVENVQQFSQGCQDLGVCQQAAEHVTLSLICGLIEKMEQVSRGVDTTKMKMPEARAIYQGWFNQRMKTIAADLAKRYAELDAEIDVMNGATQQ